MDEKIYRNYVLDGLIKFYNKWRHASLWLWIAQILYLTSLVGLIYFSIGSLIYWIETSKATPYVELVSYGWIFGTVAGLFVWRWIYDVTACYILKKLGIED